MDYQNTLIWRKLIEVDQANEEASKRLAVAYSNFRERATHLTQMIQKALPDLTIHDVTHLDGLWYTGSLLIDETYHLNPMEAFVFGGAVLLHDSAMSYEAFGGVDALRNSPQWKDTFALAKVRNPKSSEVELIKACDFAAMRHMHADHASVLATQKWKTGDGSGELFLLEDGGLRNHVGPLMGKIATSHHWDLDRLRDEFSIQANAIPGFPPEWSVDPLKVALLLRCADALHIDQSRAPDFLHAITKRSGISYDHWQAQNWLAQPAINQNDPSNSTVAFTSTRSFDETNSSAWWVAYEALSMADREIKGSNRLLDQSSSVDTVAFKVKGIVGIEAPADLAKYITVTGWTPLSTEIHVSNIAKLIETLGGQALYASNTYEQKLLVVLRELLQNSMDAISARKCIEPAFEGKIHVKLTKEKVGLKLSISDNGVGMSERVLTGPLLDFNSSFWASDLITNEFPGLASSGFKSAGQFGIGFYSIFMVSEQVAVYTRRFDGAAKDAKMLKFANGISLRPQLLSVDSSSHPMSISTNIDLILTDEEFCEKPTFKFGQSTTARDAIDIDLKATLQILLSTSSIKIEFTAPDGTTENITSQYPPENDKKADWLDYHLGNDLLPVLDETRLKLVANNLRYIDASRTHLGFAALNPFIGRSVNGGGVKTVTGIRPNLTNGTDNFFGFMDCLPDSAKRNPGEIIADTELIQAWLREQISLLEAQSVDDMSWHFISGRVSSFDIDPTPYIRMPVKIASGFQIWKLDTFVTYLQTGSVQAIVERRLGFCNVEELKELNLTHPRVWPFSQSWLSMNTDYDNHHLKFSFLSCLDKKLELQGRKLVIKKNETTIQSSRFGSPLDIITISSKTNTN